MVKGCQVSKEGWLKIEGKSLIPVDIMMESRRKRVLIEIESHRQDPSNNIAKIPFWLKRNPPKKKLLIIQLFSPFYEKHKLKRQISQELGTLIMEKFGDDLAYKSISFQPKLSFEEFNVVYDAPEKNRELMEMLIQKTSEKIVELLSS